MDFNFTLVCLSNFSVLLTFYCLIPTLPIYILKYGGSQMTAGLALACLTPPFGAVLCHKDSHIMTSECGAPEFFSGAKLIGLNGVGGKLTPEAIIEALEGLKMRYPEPEEGVAGTVIV